MRPLVAVFGSSEPVPGQPLYESARAVGRRLAETGHDVITGGYGGVMEAASRGATEGGGGAVGVICDIFSSREPNEFLTERVPSSDLFDRTRELIQRAAGFVVLGGKAGTLSELTFLWALHRAGCLPRTPVVLLGDAWQALLDTLSRENLLDAAQRDVTRIATSPDDVVRQLGLKDDGH